MKEQPIKINDIKQVMCFLYSPDDEFIGTIESEYSWNDVRIQIMEIGPDHGDTGYIRGLLAVFRHMGGRGLG